MTEQITIALSKGRILTDTLPLLEKMDLLPVDDFQSSRKLIFESRFGHVRFLIARASDVPTYVASGAADLGIAGKDVLLESDAPNLCEFLDLKIAQCRLMVAVKEGQSLDDVMPLRIATKYIRSARDYFSSQGKQIELFKLYGSVEISPLVGLADAIVDLVDTGNTLKANKLVATEVVADISSRLIGNRDNYHIRFKEISRLVEQFRTAVGD